jgi:pimeloyl-ACP methyl ester carboxylesterase
MKFRSLLLSLLFVTFSAPSLAAECVILLHGLIRTSSSMAKLEDELANNGYFVVNIDYPSREKPVEELAITAVNSGLEQCAEVEASPVNFVTHSLGGILVRQYYSHHDPAPVHRVVMLGPPNNGSEVVDNLRYMPGFELLNGPAGMQLGTDQDSIPAELGPVNFEVGIIAGTRSINLILSAFLPNPDDGKVSAASTRVEGMCGFVALPVTHPFMMQNDTVISEIIAFLKKGKFASPSATAESCSHSPDNLVNQPG